MQTPNTVADLYASIEETRSRLRETIQSLAPEQLNARDEGGGWTPAEIVEHLAIVNGQIVRLMGRFVERAETEGAPAAAPDGQIKWGGLAPIAERAAREKFNAPETAVPKGGAEVSDSLARLTESHAALLNLRPRIEAHDLSACVFPHPAFGPLDFYQWLALLGLHEERHRQQIERIKGDVAR